ncbi:hypothetical protein SAMN05878276_1001 [Aquipseudomonas alcaligenes]|uniref:WcbI family polysaccharide biosynthesis putative acetyltransferase n=1 Tax=Aquipseudomonas alcaligenes TaxID=43263 RepID=UPI000956BA76|nr:WcbI family polysaccharide biosynthesis putative acetyltransferase [Pseudomonas alcaligenes]SIR93597.1 hypothetical protein SAMN05878276_1001 [Pseudomonas alcaligenes]
MIVHGNTAPDAELVILYGNCQTVPLALQLAAADSSPAGRGYACVLNHAVPGHPRELPEAKDLQRCVLYLEQYDREESIAVRDAVRRGLPDGCPRLIFPAFMFYCPWPFYRRVEPRAEMEPGMPWGRYPYGDSVGLEIARQGLAEEQSVAAYMQLSNERMPDLQHRLQIDIERITRHDAASDIVIGDYVLANFRRKHLFWTPGHVCNEALGVLAQRLFKATLPLLGGDAETGLAQMDAALSTYSGMSAMQLPIHPQVARALELEFCDEQTPMQWFGNRWNFSQYIRRYIAYDRSWQIVPETPLPACCNPAVDLYRTELQFRAARHLRWMPGHISVDSGKLTIDGWALSTWDAPEAMRLLINGEDVEQLEWPLASPDMLPIFGAFPNAGAARFRCRQSLPELAPNDFMSLNVTGRLGEHRHSYRTAWYLHASDLHQAKGNSSIELARLGGATITMRMQKLLMDRFDRTLDTFASVLDLHCGYLTPYLAMLSPQVTGVSSDAESIRVCRQYIPAARFQLIDSQPPMPVAPATFDLVIGISLMGQFDEHAQHIWLAELQRAIVSGGLLLLSLPGTTLAVLQQITSKQLLSVQQAGILPEKTDAAAAVLRSHDYVMTKWDEYFEVIDIVEAIAGGQDLVIMRKR